jgi:ribosomal protein L11 methyltransferase
VTAAGANGEANGVELDVRRLDLLRDPLPAAETLVANLLRPLLLALAARLVHPPARLIASGLLAEEADEVAAAFAAAGVPLAESARVHEGGWASLLLERP